MQEKRDPHELHSKRLIPVCNAETMIVFKKGFF